MFLPKNDEKTRFDLTDIQKYDSNIDVSNEWSEVITGNDLDNTISAKQGNDVVYGLEGNDKLYGGNGSDILVGGKGNDELYGGNGSDVLHGGEGDDLLYGYYSSSNGIEISNTHNDTLYGGSGNDILAGGIGRDTYIFTTGDGVDTIREVNDAKANLLKFYGGYEKEDFDFSQESDNLIISVDTNDDTVLENKITIENYFREDYSISISINDGEGFQPDIN